MNLKSIYKVFKTEIDCIKFLQEALWPNSPVCPYCKTSFFTPIKNSTRYHCNKCNSSFSVTVGTMFHRTRCDVQKWFMAILLMSEKKLSVRELADKIEVTKDTAWLMMERMELDKDNFHKISLSLKKLLK